MLQLSLLMKDTSIRQADENIVIKKKKVIKRVLCSLNKTGRTIFHSYSSTFLVDSLQSTLPFYVHNRITAILIHQHFSIAKREPYVLIAHGHTS